MNTQLNETAMKSHSSSGRQVHIQMVSGVEAPIALGCEQDIPGNEKQHDQKHGRNKEPKLFEVGYAPVKTLSSGQSEDVQGCVQVAFLHQLLGDATGFAFCPEVAGVDRQHAEALTVFFVQMLVVHLVCPPHRLEIQVICLL